MLLRLILLFIVCVHCTVTDPASSKKAKYEALRKQQQQEEQESAQNTLKQEAEAAEEALRQQFGGQAGADAAKKKLADYVASIGGEQALKARIEQYGQEAVSRELMDAVHGRSPPNPLLQYSVWGGLALLLAVPFTRNEILYLLSTLQEVFAVDRRGVLSFRVGAGLIVAADAIQRLTECRALYSDEGVFPRSLAIEDQATFTWSLYFASGHLAWAGLLLVLTVFFGLCLAAGFKSRLSCVACWVLLSSIHTRNPYTGNVSDDLLRICLLWAAFLPLSDLASLDNYLSRGTVVSQGKKQPNAPASSASSASPASPASPVVGSLAAIGILFQLAWFYFESGQSQIAPGWTSKENYSALYYLLSAPTLALPPANTLVAMAHDPLHSAPTLRALRIATQGIPLLERWGSLLLVIGPLFCLVSESLWWIRDSLRMVLLIAFTAFTCGLLVTLKTGILPFVLLAIQSMLLPSSYFDLVGKCLPSLPSSLNKAEVKGEDKAKLSLHPRGLLATLFCVFLIAHTAFLNISDSNSELHEALQDALGTRQSWSIFQEMPEIDTFLVISAKLKRSDERFDMQQAFAALNATDSLPPLQLRATKPVLANPFFSSFHWANFAVGEDEVRVKGMAMYICKEWNKVNRGPDSVESLSFQLVEVKVKQPKQPLTGHKAVADALEILYDHACEEH